MPHRIRLRDWSAARDPAAPDARVLTRRFHRPSNLAGCSVVLRVQAADAADAADAAAAADHPPDAARLNGQPLSWSGEPAQQPPSRATAAFEVPVEQLEPRNEFSLIWNAASPAAAQPPLVWLEIEDPSDGE